MQKIVNRNARVRVPHCAVADGDHRERCVQLGAGVLIEGQLVSIEAVTGDRETLHDLYWFEKRKHRSLR